MIFRGGVYIIETTNEETSLRIINWAYKGSNNFNKTPLGIIGANISIREIEPYKLLMGFSHNLFFNYAFAFKLIFMLQARKIRKHYKIRTPTKVELYNIYEGLLCKTK